MARPTVRNVDDQIVKALKKRAAEHGRAAEAEHREILRAARLDSGTSFAERAASLRKRLRSTSDSVEIIRATGDGAFLLPVHNPDAIVTIATVQALHEELP